jgi:hypothetical protein
MIKGNTGLNEPTVGVGELFIEGDWGRGVQLFMEICL